MRKEISREQAEELFHSYSSYVYQTALYITKSKVLADDITQETFIRVFDKYHTYDPTKPIKPWIYKIVLNIARNMLRKQKWLTFIGVAPEQAGSNTTEQFVLQDERNQELWRDIDSLSVKSREVVVLHFFSGLKLHEAAEVLGIPIGTCKSRLNTALKQLRKQLPEGEN